MIQFMKSTQILILLSISCLACNTAKEVSNQPTNLSDSEILDRAKEIHTRTLVLDTHADIAMPTTSALYLSEDGKSKVHISKLKSGGTNALLLTLAVPPGPRTSIGDAQGRTEMNNQLAFVKDMVSSNSGHIEIAKNSESIRNGFASQIITVILGFQNARALERDLNSIDSFYNEGVRVFGFNHIGHNDFSDSSRPFFDSETGKYELAQEHSGLSTLGQAAVKRINHLGAIIDVSQQSKLATLQTTQLSIAPVIASHSNARSISDVSRNLSDEEIKLIARKGGVVCVSPFRAYLLDYSDPSFVERIKSVRRNAGISEKYSYPFELYWEIEDPSEKLDFLKSMSETLGPAYVEDLIKHINYIVDKVGIDHVGIGSDFNHGGGITDYSDAADAFNVTLALVKQGYTKEEIQKIWSGNFLRVLEQVEQLKQAK